MLFVSTVAPWDKPHSELVVWLLDRAGWDVTTVAPHAGQSVLRRVMGGRWTTRDLPAREGGRSLRFALRLGWELLRARFGNDRVVYLHSQALGYQAALLFLGPRGSKRLVYHNPDYYCPIRFRWRSWLEGVMCRSCDLHINHEYHRGYALRAQHRMRCPILISPPNLNVGWPIPAPDAAARRELMGEGAGGDFILRLHSSYEPLRMVGELFEALALLPPRFRLVMGRQGSAAQDREVDSELIRLGIFDRVLRLPRLEYCDLFRYTANCDAGVLLYANNDLGNFFQSPGRLTEYLACGLPVLSSDFTGLECLVRRHDIGECADARDAGSIAAAILRLESGMRSGRFGIGRLRKVFEQHFAIDLWGPQVVAAFEELVSGRRRREPAPPPVRWWPGRGAEPAASEGADGWSGCWAEGAVGKARARPVG